MKYIRTEDCIYEVITTDCGWEIAVYTDNDFGEKYIQEDDIINQADTIEELCDEFVVIYNESKKFKKPFTSFYSDIIGVLKEHDLSECKVYGAIWTDKGLIYVAKMNDKGEFELL